MSVICCICGYEFEEGVTYLVFAVKRDDDSYITNIRTLTHPQKWAHDYIDALVRIDDSDQCIRNTREAMRCPLFYWR